MLLPFPSAPLHLPQTLAPPKPQEGRAGRKNDEKIQTRRAAQDDMRPLLEGSILFKVTDRL